MTYSFRNWKISFGLWSSSSLSSVVSESSSSMISLQRSMHSSQMYTPGPAMSFLTCFCDFPQKEHFSRSPPSPMRATYASSPSCPLTARPAARMADGTPPWGPLHLVCRLTVVSASLQSTQFPRGQHLVHETVRLGLLRRQDLVPLDVG